MNGHFRRAVGDVVESVLAGDFLLRRPINDVIDRIKIQVFSVRPQAVAQGRGFSECDRAAVIAAFDIESQIIAVFNCRLNFAARYLQGVISAEFGYVILPAVCRKANYFGEIAGFDCVVSALSVDCHVHTRVDDVVAITGAAYQGIVSVVVDIIHVINRKVGTVLLKRMPGRALKCDRCRRR